MTEIHILKNTPPPRNLAPAIVRLKRLYGEWMAIQKTLAKLQRYSIGIKIDSLLVEALEAGSAAVFAQKGEKVPYLRVCVRKLDTVSILFSLLWENKCITTERYAPFASELVEIGKICGGWLGQAIKNSPESQGRAEEK